MSKITFSLLALLLAFAISASAQNAQIGGMQLQDLDLQDVAGFTSYEVCALGCLSLRIGSFLVILLARP